MLWRHASVSRSRILAVRQDSKRPEMLWGSTRRRRTNCDAMRSMRCDTEGQGMARRDRMIDEWRDSRYVVRVGKKEAQAQTGRSRQKKSKATRRTFFLVTFRQQRSKWCKRMKKAR